MTHWHLPARRPPWWTVAFAIVAIAAIVAAGIMIRFYVRSADTGGYVSRDLDGDRVEWGAAPDIGGSRARPTGQRFRMPEQGLDVALKEASVTGSVINPPDLTAAFLMRDYGDPADPGSGLSVVAFHAVEHGNGPGNALVDPESDVVAVTVGDPVEVGAVEYRVTRTMVESKSDAAADLRIWGDAAKRGNDLVILACLLQPDDPLPEQDNLVVLATRIGPTT